VLTFSLPKSASPLKVLGLGAHSDDLEIGCGGTVLRLVAERQLDVHWVVWGCSAVRAEEARRSAETLLGTATHHICIHDFRDGFFPYVGERIKEAFEELKGSVSPDLIFTHARDDLHQDHRLINELTWNTFRDHLILEYEIPKYDGGLASPNVFVPLDASVVGQKLSHVMSFFSTQRDKRWFTEETFRGLLRLRGVEAGVHYAEAFELRKGIVALQ